MSLKVSLVINAVSQALNPIRQTQNKLKALQEQTGKVEAYRKAQKALLQKTRALRDAKIGMQTLLTEQAKTGNRSKSFQNSLNSARQAVSAANNNVKSYTASLARMRTELQQSGINTRQLRSEQARLDTQINRTQRLLARKEIALRAVSRAYGVARSGGSKFWSGMKKGLVYGGLVVNTLGIVKNSIAGIVSPFINFASGLEQSQFQLSAMLGSAEKGKDAMQWIKDFANENPAAPLDAMIDAFTQLTAFGMPAKDMMKSLIDYNSAYGGSLENLNSMVLQLGQGWSNNALQGEDAKTLRQRGINVAKLLADFTKRTQPEAQWLDESQVNKLISQGRIGRDAIRAIVEQMGYEQKGKAKEVGTTWAGLMSQLTLTWQNFQETLMNAGVFDVLKTELKRFSDWMREQGENGNMKKWAEAFANGIVPAIQNISNALSDLVANIDKIKNTYNAVDKYTAWMPSRWLGDIAADWLFKPSTAPASTQPSNTAYAAAEPLVREYPNMPQAFAKVQIAFDASGMPRMKADSPSKGLELETMTGRSLVGVGL